MEIPPRANITLIQLSTAISSQSVMATSNYDFIIIGGGTAGLVLANRLTEDSTVQVLVLEAGEDLMADPRTMTPLLYPTLMGTDADWNSVSEPQVGPVTQTCQ
jgi:choline dehydrogenase-like flavoprotein